MNRSKLVSTLEEVRDLVDECLVELGTSPRTVPHGNGPGKLAVRMLGDKPIRRLKAARMRNVAEQSELTFDTNPRFFMKKHARRLNGPQKFTLLVAWLAKGDRSRSVSYGAVHKAWGKMTAILGKFNPAHSTRAKDNGWVDTPRQGHYILSQSWKESLGR